MWSRLFTLAAALSAVLCVAAVGGGAAALVRDEPWRREWATAGGRRVFAEGRPGAGTVAWVADPRDETFAPGSTDIPAGVTWQEAPGRSHAFGVGDALVMTAPGRPDMRVVTVSPIRVAGATAVLPLAWVAARLWARGRAGAVSRHRRRLGLCLACGYDLRGTPAGGRCGECGEPAAAAGVGGA